MHKTLLGICMSLIWLSYFDPRKDGKRVWWRSGDLTDTRMADPWSARHRYIKSFLGGIPDLGPRFQLLLSLKFFILVTFIETFVL